MWNLIPWKKRNDELSANVGREWPGLADFRREFAEIWDSLLTDWNDGPTPGSAFSGRNWGGELLDRENDYLFQANVPGFKPEEIDVKVSGCTLSVKAEHREEAAERGDRSSYRYGAYQQTFTLPRGVDADHIEARYQNGVLELRLPKTEEARGKRVPVHAG